MGVCVPRWINHCVLLWGGCFKAERLCLVLRQQFGQISTSRNQEAECVGTLRHARERDGMDARRIRTVFGRAGKQSLGESDQAVSTSCARWLLERWCGHVAVLIASCFRSILETAGSSASKERVVRD